jgi:hypothetical protein
LIRVKAAYLNETYVNTFIYRFITENGTVKESTGEVGEYALNNEKYVRIEVIGENGAMLFTQPVYRKECISKAQ